MLLALLLFTCAQQQVQILTPGDPGANADDFGTAVDIHGDLAIVGAPSKTFQGLNFAGAAYIYRRTAGVWTEEAKLLAPFPELHDEFGTSVKIQGDVAVVGAPDFPQSVFAGTGRAWVYRRVGGVWAMEQELVPSGAGVNSSAGRYLDFDGSTIVVASGVNLFGGRLTVFEYNGSNWIETDVINAPVASVFGTEIELQGDRMVVSS